MSWCISSREIYLAGVSVFWREYLQQFILNFIFMTAGFTPNRSIYFYFLLFVMDYTACSIHQRETGESGSYAEYYLALLSLTRPNGIIVIGLFIVWSIIMVWQKFLSWRVTIRGVLVTTFIAIVLIAPWTIRNYLVSHTFIPVAIGDGTVLLGADNNEALTKATYPGGPKGTWINPIASRPDIVHPFPLHTCTPPCEVAREAAFKDAAIKWIQDNIHSMPYLLELHFINIWQPDTHEADLPTDRFINQKSTQLVLGMMKTIPIPMFILAALGLVVTLRRWRELLFIYFMITMTIAECIIYYGIPRFRAPIEPMLILLAAGSIWWLTHKEKGTLHWTIDNIRSKDQISTNASDQSESSLASNEERVHNAPSQT